MTAKAKPRHALNKKAIQRYLIDRDMAQDDFAKALGISTSHLNEPLDGRRGISLNNLFPIAEETAIDVRELVMGADE